MAVIAEVQFQKYVQFGAKEMDPNLKFTPSEARQLGLLMHSQSANHGKLKLNSLDLASLLLLHPVHEHDKKMHFNFYDSA